MVVDSLSDRPRERFAAGEVVQLASGDSLTVSRFEATDRHPLITFAEVTDRKAAERLRGEFLFVSPDRRRTLERDEYWPEDLIGLEVRDRAGTVLGRVEEVLFGAGQDRLAVGGTGAGFEVPFVAELVPEVDVERRVIVVDLPEGLTG